MEIWVPFILILFFFALNLFLLWRFFWYKIPGFLLLLILPLSMVFFKQPNFELDFFWWQVGGVALILIGSIIFVLAFSEFKKNNLPLFGLPETLVTTGLYQYLRHPQYLGVIFVLVGWWWVWAKAYAFYFGMFVLAMIWIQGYLEEKLILEKRFKDKYQKYHQQTGMFWIK
jgi:protein-S-isoprenylcysteine O-methyltransferase Ste14